MRVTCEKCRRSYDDLHQYTICPHNPLEFGPDAEDYCRKHDLPGPCPLCKFHCTHPLSESGQIYHCDALDCPIHGERNRAMQK